MLVFSLKCLINKCFCQIAWAPGKCMKDKQWKDYWDVEYGVSYIPYDKLDHHVNLIDLEEGGTFDEETIPDWIKNMRSSGLGMPMTPSAATMAPNMLPDMSKLTGKYFRNQSFSELVLIGSLNGDQPEFGANGWHTKMIVWKQMM